MGNECAHKQTCSVGRNVTTEYPWVCDKDTEKCDLTKETSSSEFGKCGYKYYSCIAIPEPTSEQPLTKSEETFLIKVVGA